MLGRVSATWQRFTGFASQERFLIGASIFRIVAGLALLYQYLISYHQRFYLFGPEGAWPFERFQQGIANSASFSLYAVSASPFWFDMVYHTAIVVTTLWLVGWRTRLMTVLTYVFLWSLHERTPVMWDGGDNLIRLVLIYGCFANLGAYFSFDAERLRAGRARGGPLVQASAMLHSAAILAFALQLCLVYGVSGLYKVQGEMWQNGTALYYVMRVDEYTWPGFSELIYQNVFLVTAGTYATVAFQVAFPFLLFLNRYTRLLALACGMFFHLGIAAFMGLITFSALMISVELALVSDREYRWFGRRLSNTGARLKGLGATWQTRIRQHPRLAPLRVQVLYDGWCPLCTRSVARLERLDWLGLLVLTSFREPGVLARSGVAIERAEARMQAIAGGTVVEGIHAISRIATRLPLLWPALPLLWLAARLGVGQQVYDWLATRRTIVPAGCDSACEIDESVGSLVQRRG
jgi:predicted DCC family thiol-disulfide oxidoreductase YuxK